MSQEILNILITIGLSMLPVIESKGGITFGIGVANMPMWEAFLWSILGNILIVVILLKLLDPVTNFLMKHSPLFNRYLNKLYEKTRHHHSKRFKEIGAIFLVTLVILPLPMSGGWSATLVAFLFGVRFWAALPLISLGVIGAAMLAAVGVESLFNIFDWAVLYIQK